MIIDGHNDLVLHCWRGEPTEHLDLDAARAAGFAGGFFALYVPSPPMPDPTGTPYAVPLPPAIPFEEADRVAEELFAALCALPVERATSVDDFRVGRVTAIVHMEGAEPIAPDLSNLERWYERGLRSIGLVWSRPNDFAEGVPFRFPASPDTGGGLTPAGRELVRACNRLGILVDVSHLNEAGFWDVAGLSDAPLVATHSNAHALCAASRNLLDSQLDAIGALGRRRRGQLRRHVSPRGRPPRARDADRRDRAPDRLSRRAAGHRPRRVRLRLRRRSRTGRARRRVGLPKLVDALRAGGYDNEAVAKITHENWLRVLRETWR